VVANKPRLGGRVPAGEGGRDRHVCCPRRRQVQQRWPTSMAALGRGIDATLVTRGYSPRQPWDLPCRSVCYPPCPPLPMRFQARRAPTQAQAAGSDRRPTLRPDEVEGSSSGWATVVFVGTGAPPPEEGDGGEEGSKNP
jgi:hypothetical protein